MLAIVASLSYLSQYNLIFNYVLRGHYRKCAFGATIILSPVKLIADTSAEIRFVWPQIVFSALRYHRKHSPQCSDQLTASLPDTLIRTGVHQSNVVSLIVVFQCSNNKINIDFTTSF